ncbi:hypothetical protein Glove_121g65 [Diversispora epigaea]|uniref:Peptide hydrolase n=1 Tax=Diversispora epigaea TaxID=1348612 RepID=A0A397J821_9GLOM|nr:hypothetical protein Glove_121g65 [Diversispora epigaea]
MVNYSSYVSLFIVISFVLLVWEWKTQQVFDLSYYDESQVLASLNEGKKLIQTGDTEIYLMTEEEALNLKRKNIKFMDITDYLELGLTYKEKKIREYPIFPTFQDEVAPFIGNLTTDYMRKNLEKFTSFRNRYYRSKYGVESSEWLFKKVSEVAENSKKVGAEISVKQFRHKWDQKSIIARFEGSDPQKDNEVVIVGAHQDSVNMWIPTYGRSPGADDDGSGTVTILEAFRVLVEGDFKPQRPVEFHWYSAEEGGLLGSQHIASEYEKEGRDVIAMLQNDMTGYIGKKPESVGIIVDFVDPDLTLFLRKLVTTYATIPSTDTKCGYACSDHASWRKAGYPSAFTIEGEFSDSNPYIHSANDIIGHLSFDHMLEFSKLSVSFAIELSHI